MRAGSRPGGAISGNNSATSTRIASRAGSRYTELSSSRAPSVTWWASAFWWRRVTVTTCSHLPAITSSRLRHHVRVFTAGPGATKLTIVDHREIWQHDAVGKWHPFASADINLVCLVTAGDVVYAGSADARVLRLEGGDLVPLSGFDHTPGRDEWHPVGSPLRVRSLTATAD